MSKFTDWFLEPYNILSMTAILFSLCENKIHSFEGKDIHSNTDGLEEGYLRCCIETFNESHVANMVCQIVKVDKYG